jgi:hypothetical protein
MTMSFPRTYFLFLDVLSQKVSHPFRKPFHAIKRHGGYHHGGNAHSSIIMLQKQVGGLNGVLQLVGFVAHQNLRSIYPAPDILPKRRNRDITVGPFPLFKGIEDQGVPGVANFFADRPMRNAEDDHLLRGQGSVQRNVDATRLQEIVVGRNTANEPCGNRRVPLVLLQTGN